MNLLILLVITIGTKAAAINKNDLDLQDEAAVSIDAVEEELARSVRDLIYWNRVYNQLKSE